LTCLAGSDALHGLGGNDILNGGAGNDLLDGGAGIDIASYADASAAVKVNPTLTGAQNTDGSGSDTLVGIENLVGSAYNDTLTGDAGANLLDGNGGSDTLTGGAGADTFVFDVLTTTSNKDTVKDFVSGTDRIERRPPPSQPSRATVWASSTAESSPSGRKLSPRMIT
jgi:Ca2+-binding RTX toxin-like protein